MKEVGNHEDLKSSSREVGRITLQKLKLLPNVLPLEVSHSSLDIFERSPVLITFDSSFEQKTGLFIHPMGRRLNLRLLVIETIFWLAKTFFGDKMQSYTI